MRFGVWACAGLCLVAMGCGSTGGPVLANARGDAASMPEAAEGQALYETHCVACHGASGKGDGPLAAAMSSPPSDLTRIAASNGGTVPRAEVLSQLDGYLRQGVHASAMPEFGAELTGVAVPVTLEDGSQSPVPRPLAALLVYIESIQD